jgi:hypothetical protein
MLGRLSARRPDNSFDSGLSRNSDKTKTPVELRSRNGRILLRWQPELGPAPIVRNVDVHHDPLGRA